MRSFNKCGAQWTICLIVSAKYVPFADTELGVRKSHDAISNWSPKM